MTFSHCPKLNTDIPVHPYTLTFLKMPYALVFLLVLLPLNTLGQTPLQVESTAGTSRSKLHTKSPFPAKATDLKPRYRLNDTYIPFKYDLELQVFLDDEDGEQRYTAPGVVKIGFEVSETTNRIILHANRDFLEVDEGSVKVRNLNTSTEQTPTTITYSDDDRHFMYLNLPTDLDPISVRYEIYAEFIAQVSTESLDGLYLSYYTDNLGVERRLATTQMQAYSARQLFPGFDEPGLRAIINLKVTHKNNYPTVLGNSDILDSSPHPDLANWTITTFNPTVPMPTYLFAMLVSDFEYAEADPSLFIRPVRTYAPPPVVARNGANYSADIAAGMLTYFDEYFDTVYPMPKMDSVHAPHFSAGAMENWGLNIYREAYLIYYPDESTEAYKNLLTSVVSHELAHQNFGNRVTCKWWNEIWLNEAFATYVSYLGVDGVRSEFRQREWILNDAFQYSMRVDVSASTHPIINDALSPDDIDNYWTGITYEKGGCVNRMTENFLTEETYKKGLRNYLKDMSGKAVVSDDLFRNLDIAAAEDSSFLPVNTTVKQILDSWVRQISHPLVRVGAAGNNEVYITQERYADPTSDKLWYVPVTVVTKDEKPGNNVPKLWLEENVALKSYPHDTSKWIMVNNDATGYYRVLYDAHLTSLIESQLLQNATEIRPLSRSQLLDDYFTLATMGHVDIQTALELTQYLEQETHFTVWEVVFTHLRQSYNLADAEDFKAIQAYLLPRVSAALQSVGLEQNANHIGAEGILRSKLVDWACALGDQQCVNYAATLRIEWAGPTATPPPIDIQAPITCTIVATGGNLGFDFILSKYKETLPLANPLNLRLLNALACSGDAAVLQNLLDMTLNESSDIDPSHRLTLIQRISMNSVGRTLVIQFLKDNVDKIIDIIGNGSVNPVGSILTTLSGYLSKQEQLSEVLKFITDNSAKLSTINTINASLNLIRRNAAWRVGLGKDIYDWMGTFLTPIVTSTSIPITFPGVTNPTTTTPPSTTQGTSGGSSLLGTVAVVIPVLAQVMAYLYRC